MKILKIDGTITVILNNGEVITRTNCSEELFNELMGLVRSEDEAKIKQLLVPELCAEERKFVAKKHAVETIHEMVEKLPEIFEVRGNALYRNGINLSIPEQLALEFVSTYDKFLNANLSYEVDFEDTPPFQGLDNFWMWCALNPNPQSREDLFRFLTQHEMKITNQGMFLAYRRVVSTNGSNRTKDLISFISNKYVQVKTKWKKNPVAYEIHELNNHFELRHVDMNSDVEITFVGNLQDMYLDLPNMTEQQFTDAHTHTMDYRIGMEARIPRHEGNQSNQVTCSKGLHVASKAYNYAGFGDTAVMVAVNPMDVLAVPNGEDGKLRTCAFTPVAVLELDEENQILEEDIDVSDLLFTHYDEQVDNLRDMVANYTAYELHVNHILGVNSASELHTILNNLEYMQDVINDRVTHL
jgi:hypothetical protein